LAFDRYREPSCRTPITFPAGSRSVATHNPRSSYRGRSIAPPHRHSPVAVSSFCVIAVSVGRLATHIEDVSPEEMMKRGEEEARKMATAG